METKDDIKNTAKYMDDSLLHKDDSDEGGSGDEEVQKKKGSASGAQKRTRKNSEGGGGEPKSRRQSKSSRVGAPPPRKRQSRNSEKEKPDVLKKYESELAKSQSLDIPPKRTRGRPKLTEEEKLARAELRDRERVKKNLAKLKKECDRAKKTKDFMIDVKELMDREKVYDKVQDAADDTSDPADKAQFGFVHCDRDFIDRFLALKNRLKVKGMVFQTTMAYDVDGEDDDEEVDTK